MGLVRCNGLGLSPWKGRRRMHTAPCWSDGWWPLRRPPQSSVSPESSCFCKRGHKISLPPLLYCNLCTPCYQWTHCMLSNINFCITTHHKPTNNSVYCLFQTCQHVFMLSVRCCTRVNAFSGQDVFKFDSISVTIIICLLREKAHECMTDISWIT